MTLKEIETRLAAIAQEVETDGADLDALEAEARTLKEARKTAMENAEKRSRILSAVSGMTGTPAATAPVVETRNFSDMTAEEVIATPEYRSAFSKKLQGRTLSEVEQRAYSSAASSAGAAIPTELANDILTKAKQYAPLLDEITLLHVPGGVTYAVEGTNDDPDEHTENGSITSAGDTLVSVTLTAYEITKLIQVSQSVKTMAIPEFEAFLVNTLAEGIAVILVKRILAGSGSSQATGVEKANSWDSTNSVTVGGTASLTTSDVLTVISLLNGGYDRNAKFVMSKKTLFQDFIPLQDKAKNDIVSKEGNQYFIQGYPVLLDDSVAIHEAYLGDFKKYVANMAQAINVKSGEDLRTNSYLYLGSCMFDGKPAIGEAFVKIIKEGTV
jgi:HK97 family phage major capsid protein